jgi:hypothetical protein
MITDFAVGDYVGELKVSKIAAGRYQVTGPRGSATIVKDRERVHLRNWARSRDRTMTVWNVMCAVPCDAHAMAVRPGALWGRTLKQAVDNLVPVLCVWHGR